MPVAKNNNNKIRGFSFTETAILLVIVGLITSSALPRFSSSLKNEDISVISTAGEFNNAVRLARAQWFANGQSGVVRIEGFADGEVWSGERGWPISHKASKPPLTINAVHCANVWNGIMDDDEAPRASAAVGADWLALRGRSANMCLYKSAKGNREHVISYNTHSGKVSYR